MLRFGRLTSPAQGNSTLRPLAFPWYWRARTFSFSWQAPRVGVRGPEAATPKGEMFNPFRVGLDHLALACSDEAELERVAAALAKAGVENTGVKLDPTLNKRYVAFKDPDRIAWEFYMA